MSNIIKNKSILPKVKENRLSKENFENQLLELLRKYKLLLTRKPILYLNIITTASHRVSITYYIKGEKVFSQKHDNSSIDFEKDFITLLQKFKVVGNGRGIQKIELNCMIEDIPTIKIETKYFGIER